MGAHLAAGAAQVPIRRTPPPPSSGSVDVEPKDGGPVGVSANGGGEVTFTVTNDRGFTTTYTPSCDGTGVVTSCSTSPDDNFTLDPNESTDVTVGFGVTGTSGSGQIVLHITGIVSDSGWYDVTIVAPVAPTLTQPRQNDSVFNRAHCLTSSVGVADWSCGDAVLLLSTPGYTTLDRTRRMTLAYASSTAAPQPLVAANVALDPSEPTLTRITAVLSVHDTVRTTATYTPWAAGGIRQLVLGWNAGSAPTGAYPYTLTVYAVAGSDSMGSSVSGLLQVVNRSTGNYGAGWEWLGVERLVLNQPVGTGQSQILWVDGDGSSKFYHQINSTTWIAPSEAFKDTIKLVSGQYTRTLPHGVQVVFDSTGRHIRTTNRETQVTTFYWHSATQLDSVRVPPAGSGGKTFILHYNGSSLLDSVRVGGRDVAVSTSGGKMTRWHWPDGTACSFDTTTGGRIGKAISPQGDTTVLHYASNGLVDSAKVLYGTASNAKIAVTTFAPWQAAGYVGQTPADTSTAVTTIDGPPSGEGFTSTFHVDKWGAPIVERDAYGSVTTYSRTNAAVPAMPTRILYPNGRRLNLGYDANANLTSLQDSTTDGLSPRTTSWLYGDANDLFSPSQVTDPSGLVTKYFYNSLGLTDSMIDPRSHHTVFGYASSDDSVRGQITSVTDRSVTTWIQSLTADRDTDLVTTINYNSTGNPVEVKNPAGGATLYYYDAAGRITSSSNPLHYRLSYFYDSMDRDTLTASNGTTDSTAAGCLSGEFVCNDNDILNNLAFDPVYTKRFYTNGLLSEVDDYRNVSHKYRYDPRGLLTADLDEQGVADSTFYDSRGLMTSRKTRKGQVLTFSYDSLGRETRWTMPIDSIVMFGEFYETPADTVTSAYDAVGNLLVHRSTRGDITRSYFQNGDIHTEAIHPNTGLTGLRALAADSVRTHYDAGGRVDSLLWRVGDIWHYVYKSTGDLDTLVAKLVNSDSVQRQRYEFTWDQLGRRQTIVYPFDTTAQLNVTSHYDRLGVLRELVSRDTGSLIPNRFYFTLAQDSVDAMGRPLHQTMSCRDGAFFADSMPADPCGDWLPSEAITRYFRTGAIAVQTLTGRSGSITTTDSFTYDPSGNRTKQIHLGGITQTITNIFPASSNRVDTQVTVSALGTSRRSYEYLADGSRWADYIQNAPTDPPSNAYEYQYDAAGRMVGEGHDFFTAPNSCGYDPDGRTFQPCGRGPVVFLGDNVVRDPDNFWTYVPAPGLDEPLTAVRRITGNVQQAQLFLVSDGLGQLVAIGDSAGAFNSTYEGPQSYAPGTWATAGITTRAQTFDPRRVAIDSTANVSSFRTRQYDPGTGSWLQEDHAGLTGGVNLYQYNGNDPNSFSDPFGLCPVWLDGIPCVNPVDAPMAPAASPEPSGTGGSEFGMTRSAGTQMHNGFDWAAAVGTAVRAPGAGTATAVADVSGRPEGNYVQFRLTNGTRVSVLHMEGFQGIRPGQTKKVNAGDIVGFTGRTGNEARSPRASHAHVITRGVSGVTCNPRDFFGRSPSGGSCGSR
jgi:RHS repeat-associated protein